MRFDDHPFIAIWETTRACDLVCAHCRADAVPHRDPAELGTDEAERLLDAFAAAGVPLVVLTGGDPAKRPDLVDLVAHGARLGLNMGLTPSATPLVTSDLLRRLSEAGLAQLAISIDGPDAATHDGFLPLWCGNVRHDDPIRVYRHHPLFHVLRDSDVLEGKCGACAYRQICGGSRARSFAMTRDVMQSDPLCAWRSRAVSTPKAISTPSSR